MGRQFTAKPPLPQACGSHSFRGVNRQPGFGRMLPNTLGEMMKTYMCVICGYVYDEAKGAPNEGIEPGTRWEDVPLNWRCPECGAGKEDFEMMEI